MDQQNKQPSNYLDDEQIYLVATVTVIKNVCSNAIGKKMLDEPAN